MKKITLLATALVVLFTSAHATTLTVPDGDFENPSNSANFSNFPGQLVGWTINGGEFYGIGGFGSLAGGAFSGNGAFINVNGAGNGSYSATLTSDSFGTFDANSVYTLTVALGDSLQADNTPYGSPGDESFSLLANGALLKTFTLPNGTLADGSGQDFSLTVDSSDPLYSALAGQGFSLSVQLGATEQVGGQPIQSPFDNVRVTEVAVPEPGTWAMLGLGCGALVFVIRRRAALL